MRIQTITTYYSKVSTYEICLFVDDVTFFMKKKRIDKATNVLILYYEKALPEL